MEEAITTSETTALATMAADVDPRATSSNPECVARDPRVREAISSAGILACAVVGVGAEGGALLTACSAPLTGIAAPATGTWGPETLAATRCTACALFANGAVVQPNALSNCSACPNCKIVLHCFHNVDIGVAVTSPSEAVCQLLKNSMVYFEGLPPASNANGIKDPFAKLYLVRLPLAA